MYDQNLGSSELTPVVIASLTLPTTKFSFRYSAE